MVLIDTSAWIHFLRPSGDPAARARVEDHLKNGEACVCPMVRLELWNGARGDREKKALRRIFDALPELEIDAAVWRAAEELARSARAAGLTVPATDVLIASCAAQHGATLEHADKDFDLLHGLTAG